MSFSASVRVRVCVVLAAAAVAGFSGELEARPSRLAFKPLNRYDARVVERVTGRAARKLRDPQCLTLLTELKDRDGRTLGENLETWGMTAAEYLLQMPFFDGSHMSLCGRSFVELVTTPGLAPVLVCPATGRANSRLSQTEVKNPSLAEAMVIHEMLHTLGLGENPPSTFEITDLVRDRCR